MVEQETIETPVARRTRIGITPLAESLRECGICVTQVFEAENARTDMLSFEGDDETAFTAAEIALTNGYPLMRLISYRNYGLDGPARRPVPDNWVMEFSRRWSLQE